MRLSNLFLAGGLASSLSCVYTTAREPATFQEQLTEESENAEAEKQAYAEKDQNGNLKDPENPGDPEEKPAEGYDYCRTDKNSDSVSKYLAGKDVPTKKVFEGDLEKLKKLELESHGSADKYEILLVPVGYEYFDRFERLIINLDDIFKGLNVHFSSLNQPVPVSIERVERYAFLTKIEEAEIIKEKTSADKLIFVLNVEDFMGSGGNNIIISGNSSSTLYLAAHETGHGLGLGDGYERYYQKSNRSELFISIEELEPRVLEAYHKILPPINDTGNHCNGREVFTFYKPDSDLMDKSYNDEKLIDMIESGTPLFNPLQTEIMRSYAADEISAKQIIVRECISNDINNVCSFFITEPSTNSLLTIPETDKNNKD